MPSRPNRPVYFRETDAKRIAQQTREREREYRGHGLGYRATAPRMTGGAGGLIGITNETITARSGTTLGHGIVRIYHVNDDWTTTDTGQTQDCGNATGGTIPSGKWCGFSVRGGKMVIDWAEC